MANFPQDLPELRMFLLQNVRLTGRTLGEGSYGCVEEGEIPGGRCAVKKAYGGQFMDVHNSTFQRLAGGIVEECRLMSTIRHPHIVQFLGICVLPGCESRVPALVIEILETNLDSLLESHSNIPLSLKHSFLSNMHSWWYRLPPQPQSTNTSQRHQCQKHPP